MAGGGHVPGHVAHEYVLSEKDSQQELLEAVCDRFRAGEGVACRFFRMNNTYLFIADHNVLNRARLYRDRRDFVIQDGDTGKPENYPATPAHQSQNA